jgi:polyisoprenoid-binding protein YceI
MPDPNDQGRNEPVGDRRNAFNSPDFLLGVIVGAAAIFLGFGIFGFHSGGPGASAPSPTPSAAPTFVASPTPSSLPVVSPSPSAAPSQDPVATPSPTPTEPPTPSPTPSLPPTIAPTAVASAAPTGPFDSLVGSWTVTSGSSAGYRVTVHVPIFGASQVHGTTQAITGFVQIASIAGSDQIVAADFLGDLRQLQSGNSLLDRQVAQILQTNAFPTSEFRLTQPALLPGDANLAAGIRVVMQGQLTLQGVSKAVVLPATISQTSNGLVIAGSVDFLLSQFGVSGQVGGGLATVDDAATFDYTLALTR